MNPKKNPRRTPASTLHEMRARTLRQLDRINPTLPDTAAAGGTGMGMKAASAHNARMDRDLAEYTRLTARIRDLDARIIRAEKREQETK